MNEPHIYNVTVRWTGNIGNGTLSYNSYTRDHIISVNNKADILGSSDPVFRGDLTRYNPEDLLVSSLSACHMLWYLHLCAESGVIVVDYMDNASGTMVETQDGGGHFIEVTLNPIVIVMEVNMVEKANKLHTKANELCYIANSVKFPVIHKPIIRVVE